MEPNERLRKARLHLKKRQVELARDMGISPATWNEYEKGRLKLTNFAKRVEEVLGISEIWLLSGDGTMFTDDPKNMINVNVFAKTDVSHNAIYPKEMEMGVAQELEALKQKVLMLEQIIKEKEESIAFLKDHINTLKSK